MPDYNGFIGITDIVKATEAPYGTDTNFWNRILASKELRAKIGFDQKKRKYPDTSLPFFVWLAQENHAGNRNASPGGCVLMYETWIGNGGGKGAALPAIPPAQVPDALAILPANVEPADIQYPNNQPANVDLSQNGQVVEMPSMSPQARAFVSGIVSEVVREIRAEAMPPTPDKLLTCEEAADEVKMSASWVRRNVPAVRMGGRTKRWRLSDVHKFIESLPRY